MADDGSEKITPDLVRGMLAKLVVPYCPFNRRAPAIKTEKKDGRFDQPRVSNPTKVSKFHQEQKQPNKSRRNESGVVQEREKSLGKSPSSSKVENRSSGHKPKVDVRVQSPAKRPQLQKGQSSTPVPVPLKGRPIPSKNRASSSSLGSTSEKNRIIPTSACEVAMMADTLGSMKVEKMDIDDDGTTPDSKNFTLMLPPPVPEGNGSSNNNGSGIFTFGGFGSSNGNGNFSGNGFTFGPFKQEEDIKPPMPLQDVAPGPSKPAEVLMYCGGKKYGCEEQIVNHSNPCLRCHHEYYCSVDHRNENVLRHKNDCNTIAKLEVINLDEEYSIWLKHAASNLYDICLNFILVWPSLTVQWLPELKELSNNAQRHSILLGTQTSGELNHLLICEIEIPNRQEASEGKKIARHSGTFFVKKRINHQGEVHRARYMPQDSTIIATKSPSPEVFLFDCKKYPELPGDDSFEPTLRLRGHSKEGFGLSWNPEVPGRLASGGCDGMVCLWDISATHSMDSGGRYIPALSALKQHTDVVEDVAWNYGSENVCASVGDDKKLVVWDVRNDNTFRIVENAHDNDINAVNFSPFSDFSLATGSSDKTVGIWDLRNMKTKLRTLNFHQDEVMQVQWSPLNSTMLASTGKDKRVFMWNVKEISGINGCGSAGAELDDDQQAPPELIFIHGGHLTGVNDISWNQHEMGMFASVSEDNVLQVWKTSDDLQHFQPDYSDSEDDSSSEDEEEDI